jgi:hypothetical protein
VRFAAAIFWIASRVYEPESGARMYPKILLFLIPVALLLASVIIVFLWDRASRESKLPEEGNGRPEGAFRSFYHGLWILLFWSGLGISLPLWFSYKKELANLPLDERAILLGKILVFPLIFLVLLRYGARQGYLKWIDSLEWPDKENR